MPDDNDGIKHLNTAKSVFGDNVSNLADAKADADAKAKKAYKKPTKDEKEERLIQNYISHLNLMVNWGSYNEYWESKEVIKMAQIKMYMDVSKHPKVLELRALYD
jgi:hypothetical protein